ncbi:MAG: hypothetical protein Q4E74_01140 [Ruminococcus sp.]|nr:hypothetical protein [Ruminococcus sp.]
MTAILLKRRHEQKAINEVTSGTKYPRESYSYSVAGVILDIDFDFEKNDYDVNAEFDDSGDNDKQYGVNAVLEELNSDFADLEYTSGKQKETCMAALNDAKDCLNGIFE